MFTVSSQSARRAWLWRLGLWLSLAMPSLDLARKYGGTAGLVAYLLLSAVAVGLGEKLLPWLTQRSLLQQRWLLGIGLALLVLAFVILFPIADVKNPGLGSDTNEAYDSAVRALFAGRYPYDELTYLGNRIHHLPGSLLLAAPFVLLGSSALQNLFWTGLYAVVLIRLLKWPRALALLAMQFVASPVLLHQIVTGSDGVMSGLSVFIACWLFAVAWSTSDASRLLRSASLLLMVLAISNRLNFALMLIPLAAFLLHHHDKRQALRALLLVCAGIALLNLPFYFYNPQGFAPLEGMDRLTRFDERWPGVSLLLPGLAVMLTLACAVKRSDEPLDTLLLGCSLYQAFFVVSGLLLASIASGSLDTGYAAYGCYFLFPLSYLCWRKLQPTPQSRSR